jgi:hypothetical protein
MSTVATKWNSYWFREAPLLDLAILRFIAIGTQLGLMLFDPRYGLHNLAITGDVPAYLYDPILFFKPFALIVGGKDFYTVELMQNLQIATIVAGFFAFFGLFYKYASVLFAFGCGVIQLWIYSHGDIHHPEAAMVIALTVLALSPAAKVLSVDAMIGRDKLSLRDQLVATSNEAKWAILLMQWFFGLFYVSACYSKLAIGGLSWANGYTLQYYLAQDGLRWNALLGGWMSQFHTMSLIGQWGILAFQSTFFLSLIFPKLKWLYVPAGMAMHIGIYFMFKAPFFQWIALYLVFVPWTAAFVLMNWLPQGTAAQPNLAKASAG